MLPRISAALVKYIQPIRIAEAGPPKPHDRNFDPSFQRFVPKRKPEPQKKSEKDLSLPPDSGDSKHYNEHPPAVQASPEPTEGSSTDPESDRTLVLPGSPFSFPQILAALGESQIHALGKLGRKVYSRVSREGKRAARIRKGTILDEAA